MPRRVFIGLTEVAGYFGNLQRGLTELGIATTYLDESGHPFGYRQASLLGRLGGATRRLAARAAASRGVPRRAWRATWMVAYGLQLPLRLVLCLRAALRHDAFIFSTDSWLPRNLDLPLLRLLRRRVIWTFTGTDHRPSYLDGGVVRALADDPVALAAATRKVERRVRMAERYAHAIVALPASAHFHRRPIYDFLRIGIPFDAPEGGSASDPFRGPGVRVLHSPSNPLGKGTDRVRAEVAELRARGHEIAYLEISGRPHAEVLAAIRACDFVVDEVYSDTPMAGFATEAAYFGRPAVVTGWYAELVDDQLPVEDRPPSLFTTPNELASAIERLVVDAAYREELGVRAQAFVRTRWSPAEVAARYLRLLDDDAPKAWRWDPARQRYLWGWGMPRERVIDAVRGVLGIGGPEALGLAHRPELEARFTELAGSDPGGSYHPAREAG